MTASAVRLQLIPDKRGPMIVGQSGREVPFTPMRFFILDNPKTVSVLRGGHAHRRQEQFLCAVQGRVLVRSYGPARMDWVNHVLGGDGHDDLGVYVPAMTWLEVTLRPLARLLVLSSGPYDGSDYLRDERAYRAEVAA